MKVRFAPSPTGYLHIGNARPALLNWLWVRKQQGTFLLRLDDTDIERSKPEYTKAIKSDLEWLGLEWDEYTHQSARLDLYRDAAQKLIREGRLYACYETPEELDLKRKLQMKSGRPPNYDREGLHLSEAQQRLYEAEGRRPHWRFKMEPGAITWDDAVRGAQHFDGSNLSDPILIREDGTPLYTLPSVVDDMDFAITHILRGEDHVTNTAVQIQIMEALGGKPPVFAHLPLLTDVEGKGLSKRLGSLSLRDLRAAGLEPMAINSYLSALGTSLPVRAHADLQDLVNDFDISYFGRATPKFDPKELHLLNAKIVHGLSHSDVSDWLAQEGLSQVDPVFWNTVRPNLEKRADIHDWISLVEDGLEVTRTDPEFLQRAADLLPQEPWDETTWSAWTKAIKAKTGKSGKDLFRPLRLALTGKEQGPEMRFLLPLIGRAKCLRRLEGS